MPFGDRLRLALKDASKPSLWFAGQGADRGRERKPFLGPRAAAWRTAAKDLLYTLPLPDEAIGRERIYGGQQLAPERGCSLGCRIDNAKVESSGNGAALAEPSGMTPGSLHA
jgi:hypothetical protein